VESEEQILSIARNVKMSGAGFLRGGAFKPRTSPYAFKGLGLDGLELLKIAREKTGLPIVTEIMSPEYLDAFAEDVDVIQIGARNMQNFTLLSQVGALGKPVLLKRGLSSTIDELLMAAEYVMAGGSQQVILCERGIRTFETATRNTLDLSAVPVLHGRSHLPVIIDPSHATGYWHLVEPMALAAVAAGADGLIIEVHNHPEAALCDGAQSVTPQVFHRIMEKARKIREIIA
jgi:3-deoxy-7-phosphoheptulonate synthase